MSQIEEYKQKVVAQIDHIIIWTKKQPEELINWKPNQEVWSIMEVLCHVEEALRFWMGELLAVIEEGRSEWGRGMQHEGRLAAVARAGTISKEQILVELEESKKIVAQTLAAVKDQHLEIKAPHQNPKFGVQPMSYLLDHFVVEHLDIHIKQLERNAYQYAK